MAWPILWSFYQYLGASEVFTDCGASDWNVHVQAQPQEVVMLPFDINAELLNSVLWQAQSMIPATIQQPATDPTTGLDQMFATINTPWGIDNTGQAYFDDQGAAALDIVHAYIDNTGQPYLQ